MMWHLQRQQLRHGRRKDSRIEVDERICQSPVMFGRLDRKTNIDDVYIRSNNVFVINKLNLLKPIMTIKRLPQLVAYAALCTCIVELCTLVCLFIVAIAI